ncbi:Lrp/AsnC family transcriptional regulator [Rhodococcus sp. NCIMB 12038]|uniref:Lrp/AsnC family transcriptional regulator n=1 Tax=Rhodococcus sp. NCIMB 12038 TaxID=933800 RepID=UPI000B3C486B|nr:Lrp/AsnC family transcriptional regulator [Rhodococcus sp. NCIMB 12038]OUS84158.1 AsnC family transcriptional regulator [Rhodococcus sp. NCIMB 12038]
MTSPNQDSLRRDADLRLIHALQLEPRASWTELGRALSTDPVALARRWARITEEGLAWISGQRRHFPAVAVVEIECAQGKAAETAFLLADEEIVRTIDHTSGGRDLVAVVAAPHLESLSAFVIDRLGDQRLITHARTHLVTEMLVEGSVWRLNALSDDEARRIPAAKAPRPRAARQVPADLQEVIIRALYRDGRTPAGDIAAKAGVSTQRVADAIATMRHSGDLVIRTDVARSYTGWPINAWYFVQVPASSIDRLRSTLSRLAEVRLAVTTASRYNLVMTLWVRDLADVNRFEALLEKVLAGARIADRAVVIRPAVHSGRLLDARGFVTGLSKLHDDPV